MAKLVLDVDSDGRFKGKIDRASSYPDDSLSHSYNDRREPLGLEGLLAIFFCLLALWLLIWLGGGVFLWILGSAWGHVSAFNLFRATRDVGFWVTTVLASLVVARELWYKESRKELVSNVIRVCKWLLLFVVLVVIVVVVAGFVGIFISNKF